MIQTSIMFAAAVNLVATACFVNANRTWLIFLCQFFPVIFAVGLSVFAFARIMGWPI